MTAARIRCLLNCKHTHLSFYREPDYYYHNNVWIARGLTAAGRFINDTLPAFADFADQLLLAGAQLTADVGASLDLSVGLNHGNVSWVPPIAQLGTVPFNSMTQSVYSSYANFRYYAEMLNAGVLPDEVAIALMEFREVGGIHYFCNHSMDALDTPCLLLQSHGGTLSGMTHFEGHLDDMPSAGYAWASLVSDRTAPFWDLLFGHMASYASRGAFSASEQVTYAFHSLLFCFADLRIPDAAYSSRLPPTPSMCGATTFGSTSKVASRSAFQASSYQQRRRAGRSCWSTKTSLLCGLRGALLGGGSPRLPLLHLLNLLSATSPLGLGGYRFPRRIL